jgi:hypothetical protein
MRTARFIGLTLVSGLAAFTADASDGVRASRTRATAESTAPAPASATDWRDDWRRNRNAIIESDPALAFDPTATDAITQPRINGCQFFMLLIAAFDVQVIPIAAMDPSRNLFELIKFPTSLNSPYIREREIQIVEANHT